MAHATTMLSKEDMENVRRQARLKENGKLVQADTGDTWTIGEDGLVLGKGGVDIRGAGLGGSVCVEWTGTEHVLIRKGGIFFTVSVNGTKVNDSKALQPGDQLVLGKTAFSYSV